MSPLPLSKPFLSLVALLALSLAFGQGHDLKPVDAMKSVGFLVGEWTGKHHFAGPNGTELSVTARISEAVGGRYLEDAFVTTLPDGKKSDIRHLLTFDPATQKYRAWWFNNTSFEPNELVGSLESDKLVLESKPGQPGTIRATYVRVSENELGYKVEAKMGGEWRELLHTVFTRVR